MYSINHIKVVAEPSDKIKSVFAKRQRLESSFVGAATTCIRAFFIGKISGLKLFHPDCLNRVYEKSEIQIERVKEFSPEMDFFSSSTVMPQRDLTGQDLFLITPLVIFKPFKVSQERKR